MSQPRPALSVALPVYNAQNSVGPAIDSVLQGTFADLELVVVDDGSTDATPDVISARAAQDRRVRYHRIEHQGVMGAAQKALSLCRAPWIARMDADDLSLPDRFCRQWDHVQAHDWDGVGGLVEVVGRDGRPVPSWRRYQTWVNQHHDPDSIAAYRFVECPLVNPTMLARRDVWALGLRDGPWPEDYDFWLRALQHGFRFGKVPRPVLKWVDHPARLTRTDARYTREAFDRCRRMHLRAGPLQGVETVDLWGAGQTGKPWLHWLQGEGLQVRQVFEVSPRKIGSSLHGVPVVAPGDLHEPDGTPLLIAVGAAGARELILNYLQPLGYVPGRDAWFVA